MRRIFFLVLLILGCTGTAWLSEFKDTKKATGQVNADSNGIPDSIDVLFSGGIKGHFIEIHDPGYIVIKLDSGDIIDTTYSGISFDTLFDWEQTGVKREMRVKYTNASGVIVTDLRTGIKFKLNGVITPHPIDLAMEECFDAPYASSTLGIIGCQFLELEAWEAELNRAYNDLINSKYTIESNGKQEFQPEFAKLRDTQIKESRLAWIKFRDTHNRLLKTEYSVRQGSKWNIYVMDHMIKLTKEQANRMKSIQSYYTGICQ